MGHNTAQSAPEQIDKLLITKERLKAWEACSDGYKWFLEHYPQGASYQTLYAALREHKRYDDERWLTERVFAELDCAQQVSVSIETLGADRKSIEVEFAEAAERSDADSSKLAASGYSSKLAASGYSSKLAASGDYSKLAASGDYSQLAASGDYSQLAASGYSSKLAASGDYSQLAASGDYSQLAASGDSSKLAASGDYSQLAASGDLSIVMAAANNCTASVGERGCIVLTRWVESEKRYRVSVGYVGENGIEAGKAYRLDEAGAFVEVAS